MIETLDDIIEPITARCCSCGKAVDPEAEDTYSQIGGGVLCEECYMANREVVREKYSQ